MRILLGICLVLGLSQCGEAQRERCELLRSGLTARAVECTVDISAVEITCGQDAKMGPDPECLRDIHKFTCHQLFGEKATWRGHKVVPLKEVTLPATCDKR